MCKCCDDVVKDELVVKEERRPVIPPRPGVADKYEPMTTEEEERRPVIPPRPGVADKYQPLTVEEFEKRVDKLEKEPKVVNITINL